VEIWEKRRDLYASADLWRECLGRRWPLDPATLSALLDRPGYGKHFVVRHPTSGELLGLCATYVLEDSTGKGGHDGSNKVVGSLAALLVRPTHRFAFLLFSLFYHRFVESSDPDMWREDTVI
jgi:beta-N-acetylhexosaminidase